MTRWKRCEYGDKVRIIDVDGDVFDGFVEHVASAEERSDLEKQEDGISIIVTDGRHIGFYESEIAEVVLIDASTSIAATA